MSEQEIEKESSTYPSISMKNFLKMIIFNSILWENDSIIFKIRGAVMFHYTLTKPPKHEHNSHYSMCYKKQKSYDLELNTHKNTI